MKGIYISAIAILFLCSALFPLLSMNETVMASGNESLLSGNTAKPQVLSDSFRVLREYTDEVEVINAVDYLCGVVAAEMPANYEPEALKAQAVAAYTFACHRRKARTDERYDVTDTVSDQAYISPDEQRQKWGNDYDKYSEKIRSAVEAVAGQVLTYEGNAILAAYHSISGGKTESAANVWGDRYPYLQSVESVGDVLSPNYLSTVQVSEADFSAAVKELGVTVSGDASGWITDKKTSDSGTVLSVKVCGTEVTGKNLRKALGLKSANFDASFADGNFTFTVRGYGHGIGMSQYGAQFMALQGSSYTEILGWYYPEATLETVTE